MIVEKLLKVALLGSSWVMYLMLALSVLSIGAIVERCWFFFKRKLDVDELEEKLMAALEADDHDAAVRWLESSKSRSLEAEALLPAMRYLEAGPEAVADCVEAQLVKLRQDMERGLNLLATLGNNAPFIGLMGTVIGVIISFHELGTSQAASAMGNVMSGIAEALVSTAVGLFLALPAVVAYNVIQQRVTDIEANVQSITKQLSAFLKSRQHAELERTNPGATGFRRSLSVAG